MEAPKLSPYDERVLGRVQTYLAMPPHLRGVESTRIRNEQARRPAGVVGPTQTDVDSWALSAAERLERGEEVPLAPPGQMGVPRGVIKKTSEGLKVTLPTVPTEEVAAKGPLENALPWLLVGGAAIGLFLIFKSR